MRFNLLIPALCLIGVGFGHSLSAQSTQVELNPTQDVHLRDDMPATNFGSSDVLWLGRGAQFGFGRVRTLIEFDLSSLPQNPDRVISAELSIYQHSAEPGGVGLECMLVDLRDFWDEQTATWSNQPGIGTNAWSSAFVGDSQVQGWILWEAGSIIRSHLGGRPNFGWMLQMLNENSGPSGLGYFHSREYAVNPDLRPKLTILMHDLGLQVINLAGGQTASFFADDAIPNDLVFFVFSTTGRSSTSVPKLNITLGLDKPIVLGQARANASGTARIDLPIPNKASGTAVWIQAAAKNSTSNIVDTTVG